MRPGSGLREVLTAALHRARKNFGAFGGLSVFHCRQFPPYPRPARIYNTDPPINGFTDPISKIFRRQEGANEGSGEDCQNLLMTALDMK